MPMPEMAFAANPLLTNVGLNLLPTLTGYASQGLLPVVPSVTPTGTFNEWKVDDFIRRQGKVIANYEAVPLAGFTTSERTFSVKNWGLGTPYTARDLAAARSRGITDQKFRNAKSRFVTTQGMVELEFRMQALFQTTGNWGTTIAGVTATPNATQFIQWDQAASTPVDDVLAWKRKLRLLSGLKPNTIIIPEPIILALKKNAQVIQRATPRFYSGNDPVEVELGDLEKLFGLRIFTPEGIYNSAAEGQTRSLADIWTGTTMWMGYIAPEFTDESPTAAAMFSWTGNTTFGLPAGIGAGEGPQNFGSVENDMGLFIRDYFDAPKAAIIIEATLWRSPQVVMSEAGMTFTATIA